MSVAERRWSLKGRATKGEVCDGGICALQLGLEQRSGPVEYCRGGERGERWGGGVVVVMRRTEMSGGEEEREQRSAGGSRSQQAEMEGAARQGGALWPRVRV
jgi:hypothetical protein